MHPVGNYNYTAFVAYPEGAKNEPAVIVAHAIGGVTDSERYYAMELARRGYVAFAADVFGSDPNRGGSVRSDVSLHRGRLQANVELMLTTPTLQGVVDPARIGAQGYCFGGNSVMELARGNPNPVEAAGGVLGAGVGPIRSLISDVFFIQFFLSFPFCLLVVHSVRLFCLSVSVCWLAWLDLVGVVSTTVPRFTIFGAGPSLRFVGRLHQPVHSVPDSPQRAGRFCEWPYGLRFRCGGFTGERSRGLACLQVWRSPSRFYECWGK